MGAFYRPYEFLFLSGGHRVLFCLLGYGMDRYQQTRFFNDVIRGSHMSRLGIIVKLLVYLLRHSIRVWVRDSRRQGPSGPFPPVRSEVRCDTEACTETDFQSKHCSNVLGFPSTTLRESLRIQNNNATPVLGDVAMVGSVGSFEVLRPDLLASRGPGPSNPRPTTHSPLPPPP